MYEGGSFFGGMSVLEVVFGWVDGAGGFGDWCFGGWLSFCVGW